MATLFTAGKFQAIGSNGLSAPGAKLHTYAANSLTPQATYTTQAGGSSNANPVVCNAAGQANVWLGGSSYRMILKDASDVTIWDVDNISTAAAEVYSPSVEYPDGTVGAQLNNLVWADVKDDNSGAENDAAVLAAAAICQSRGGGTVMVPPGSFPSVSIVWDADTYPDVSLRGSGKTATVFVKEDVSATPVLDITAAALRQSYCSFSDFSITGAPTCPGVRTTLVSIFTFRNLRLTNSSVGWDNVGSLIIDAYDVDLQDNVTGYKSSKSGSIYPNLIKFLGGQVINNTGIGFDIVHGSGVTWDSVDIELNGTASDVTTGGAFIRSTTNLEISYATFAFEGCWFESNKGHNLKVEAASGILLSVRDTKFIRNSTSDAATAAVIGAIESSHLINVFATASISGHMTTTIAASRSVVDGGLFYTLTDTSTSFCHREVGTNAEFISFRLGGASAAQANLSPGALDLDGPADIGGTKVSGTYTIDDTNPSSVTTTIQVADSESHRGCMVLIRGRNISNGVAFTRLYLVAIKTSGGSGSDVAGTSIGVSGDSTPVFTFSNDAGFLKITQATGSGGTASVIGG